MVPRLEHTHCDLCSSSDSRVLFEGADRKHNLPGRFRMVQCRACGHVYLSPRPSATSIAFYYPDEYAPFTRARGWLGWATAALRRREARTLRRQMPADARVLEVGCGIGDLLVPLSKMGLSVLGVDASPRAAALAPDVAIVTGTVHDVPNEQDSFDAVVMRNVIEHVPSPRADLRRVHGLLRAGGRIFIATDNFASLDQHLFGEDWYGYDLPRHLNLFSADSLRKLLEDEGFAVERIGFSLVPTHWIVSSRYRLERRGYRLRWRSLLTSKNLPLVAALLPLTVVQRLMKSGGRMTVVARKLPVSRRGPDPGAEHSPPRRALQTVISNPSATAAPADGCSRIRFNAQGPFEV